MVVKVKGAKVEQLVQYHDTIAKQLGIKPDRLVVVDDAVEIRVAAFPDALFEGDGDGIDVNTE